MSPQNPFAICVKCAYTRPSASESVRFSPWACAGRHPGLRH
ncbi:hypothetical protein RKLH11_766 [Rhodobacteraceae bacterium KLH11]|nr:hypothetical protein RKLH11_766 [Rhodobacteraceae bacterium KLH11]